MFLWSEHKLFIGMLPKGASKADVMSVFSPYGVVKELSVIKGSQPTSKGELQLLTLMTRNSGLHLVSIPFTTRNEASGAFCISRIAERNRRWLFYCQATFFCSLGCPASFLSCKLFVTIDDWILSILHEVLLFQSDVPRRQMWTDLTRPS